MTLQEAYKACETMPKPVDIRRKAWHDSSIEVTDETCWRVDVTLRNPSGTFWVCSWKPLWDDLIADDWEVMK